MIAEYPPGSQVKHFQILQLLGRGGMGEVYLAEDVKLKRKVALKVLSKKFGFDETAIARFNREAEILSSLEHPNICRVYDLIEDNGRQILVLEYIEGENLRDYRKSGLVFSEKLLIIQKIAEVLIVAHSRKIIHRDIKPANVMLTSDGDVRVLDFGLAHILSDTEPTGEGTNHGSKTPAQNENALFQTAYGEITGTPYFSSPEQARGEPTTTASDMYSFGLLIQWFFSKKPIYPEQLTETQIHLQAMLGKTLPANDLPLELKHLVQRLKSTDPESRPTAHDVLRTLSWMRDKPKRLMKRVIKIAFLLLFVIGSLLTGIGFYKSHISHNQAKAVNQFLVDMLISASPLQQGVDAKVVDVLDQARTNLEKDLSKHPVVRATLHTTLGRCYTALGKYPTAIDELRKAQSLNRDELGPDHKETLDVTIDLTAVLIYDQQLEEAKNMAKQSLPLLKKALGEEHPFTLMQMNNLASSYMYLHQTEKAESVFNQVLIIDERVLGVDHPDTLSAMNNLAFCYQIQGKLSPSEQLMAEVIQVSKRVNGPEHPNTLRSMGNYGSILRAQRKFTQAESVLRSVAKIQEEKLGSNHHDLLVLELELARILVEDGRSDQALNELQRLQEKALKERGEGDPINLAIMSVRAEAMEAKGDIHQAVALNRRVLEQRMDSQGESHIDSLISMDNLVRCLIDLDQFLEAEALGMRALELRLARHGQQHPKVGNAYFNLGRLFRKRGDLDLARQYLQYANQCNHKEARIALDEFEQ